MSGVRFPRSALCGAFLLSFVWSSAWAADPAPSNLQATPVAAAQCTAPSPTPPTLPPSATEEIPLGVGPTPTPALDPNAVVDPVLDQMAAAAAANLQACWNAGKWDAVARSVTPRFLETALGIAATGERDRAAALAALDLGPLDIASLGPVRIWSDGRGAVDIFYWRGGERARQGIAARWFLLADRGAVQFDEEVLHLPPPLGDRVTIGFAIADDTQPLQWSGTAGGRVPAFPVIALHGANRGRRAHTFVIQDAKGGIIGLLTLPPWQQGDLVLRDLPPGAYRLRDAAVPGSSLTLEVATMGDAP